jgi:hypothetical protein
MWDDKGTHQGGPRHAASSTASGPGCSAAMNISPYEQVLERIRAEYLEMPGMRLRLEQVQRLCGIERSMCKVALDSLVDAKFLCVKSDGCYARSADGKVPGQRPARGDLDVLTRGSA